MVEHEKVVEENVEKVDSTEIGVDLLEGGKKSRKRIKKQKDGKKRKGKKTKRRRRKQKGGMGHELEYSEDAQQQGEKEKQGGGKKRKGKKGKKGTKKKGKVGKWIMHVKAFAKSHKIKFPDALKHPDCKKSYKKM